MSREHTHDRAILWNVGATLERHARGLWSLAADTGVGSPNAELGRLVSLAVADPDVGRCSWHRAAPSAAKPDGLSGAVRRVWRQRGRRPDGGARQRRRPAAGSAGRAG